MTTSSTTTEGAASAAPSIVIPKGAELSQIDRMEEAAYEAIDNVQDPDAAAALLDQVTVAEHAVRLAKVSEQREQRWRGLRLRAERRYGELLGPKQPGKRTDKGPLSGTKRSGAEHFAQHQARKVAAVPADVFETYVTENSKPNRTGLLRATTAAVTRAKKKGKEIPPSDAYDALRQRSKDVRSLPSDQRPRWTERDVDLVDTVLTHLLKRRPKYSGKRLRELASKRAAGSAPRLADLQYRMMQLTSILESVDITDYDLADPDVVSEFHDDLVELKLWMDTSIALASARLDDAVLERKIAKLRDGTGRTTAEQQTAAALASKLERRRRESRLAS
jgi:hypothetical protein